MTFLTRKIAPAAAALAALVAAPALAQSQTETEAQSGAQSGAQAQQQAAPDFAESDLEAFAVAMLNVREIVKAAQPELAAAESQEAKAKIRQQATDRMVVVVEDSGLTVEDYNAIARAAGEDVELAQKIKGYVTDAEAK